MPQPLIRVAGRTGDFEIRLLRYDHAVVAALKSIPTYARSYDPTTRLWRCGSRELIADALAPWEGQVEWPGGGGFVPLHAPTTPRFGVLPTPAPETLRDHRDAELTRLRGQVDRDRLTLTALRAELAAAKAQAAARPSAPSSTEAAFRVILASSGDPRRCYRSLSRALHPDTGGGDAALMVALNAARDDSTPHPRSA